MLYLIKQKTLQKVYNHGGDFQLVNRIFRISKQTVVQTQFQLTQHFFC